MEPKSLLPSLQEPAPSSYPEPDQFTPRLSFLFSKIHFNIIISVLRYPEWYISFRFPTKPTVLKKMQPPDTVSSHSIRLTDSLDHHRILKHEGVQSDGNVPTFQWKLLFQ